MTDENDDPHARVDDVIGLLGDPHADFHWTKTAIEELLALGVKQIHVLGDFQFVGGKLQREKKTLRRLSNVLKAEGAHLFVTGGNHEGYPALFRRYPADEHGYRRLDAHITWLPRGWRAQTAEGTVVASLGGANSIDRDRRNPPAPGLIGKWWPEEQITEEDLTALGTEPVNVLLGHDAPPTRMLTRQLAKHRGFWSDEALAYADAGQAMFHRGVQQVQPTLVLSGHYHRFLDTTDTFTGTAGEPFALRSVILNRSRKARSIAIVFVDSLDLFFPEAPTSKGGKLTSSSESGLTKEAVEFMALFVRLSPALQKAILDFLVAVDEAGVSAEYVVGLLQTATRVIEEHYAQQRQQLVRSVNELVWAGVYTATDLAEAEQDTSNGPLQALVNEAFKRARADTLSTAEVGELLGINPARVRCLRAAGHLFSFTKGSAYRYPTWQFPPGAAQPLPHIDALVAAIPWSLATAVIGGLMTTRQDALRPAGSPDDSATAAMSPAEWLARGGDVEPVLAILNTHLALDAPK